MDSLLLAALIAAVPPVSIGPDDISQALSIEMPIRRVIVFPGRARVIRQGRLQVASGYHLVRLPLLPGGVDPDSVRVSAEGSAAVLRTSGRQVESLSGRLGEAEALVLRLEEQARARAALRSEISVRQEHLQRLDALLPSAPPGEADRKTSLLLPTSPARWGQVLSFLQARHDRARDALRADEARLRRLDEERGRGQAQLQVLEAGGFVNRSYEAGMLVESDGRGVARFELSYEVPGPTWSPRYRLRLLPGGRRVEVVLEAELRQSSGEDWVGADIELSTALPQRQLRIPQLQTWVLGEREDLTLVPRSRSRPPVRPRPPWPALAPTVAEQDRQARLEGYLQRRKAFGAPSPRLANESFAERRPKRSVPAPSRSVAPTLDFDAREVSQSEDEAVVLTGEVTASSAGGSSGPRYRSTALSLFERASPPETWPPGLPSETRGADLRYAAASVPVPSGPKAVSLPVSKLEVDVTPFHRATPSLASTAFLRAEVKNPTDRPWLSGPAKLFAGDEPLGEVRIGTTGPGGKLTFALGRDERLEVARRVVSRTEKTGFLNGRRKQIFEVTLEVVNHSPAPTMVEILEPIPVDVSGRVDVSMLRSSPSPVPLDEKKLKDGLPRSGILTYRMEVSAKGKREVNLSYQVEHAASDRVVQQ